MHYYIKEGEGTQAVNMICMETTLSKTGGHFVRNTGVSQTPSDQIVYGIVELNVNF